MVKFERVELPLEERQKLRKIARGRMIGFFLLVVPLSAFLLYLLFLAIRSFVDGKQDTFSYVYTIGFILFYSQFYKYVLPQFTNALIYRKAQTKQIIATEIKEIYHFNHRPYVRTDWGTLNTASSPVLFWDINAHEVSAGMTLYIHTVPEVKKEILRVTTKSFSV